MLTDLIDRLKKHGVAEAAYKSGVSICTIKSIIAGRMVNPTIGTLAALQDFCDQKDEERAIAEYFEGTAAHMEEQNKSTFYNFS